MGHQSRARASRKAETIHRRKLFDGKTTADELHREHAFPHDAYCGSCGSRKIAVRARTFAPMDWVLANSPQWAMMEASKHNGQLPVVPIKGAGGSTLKYVRIGDAYACDLCKKQLEVEAAKGPSFVIVHFDHGPGPEKTVVQVK
jgi:hypothetical protein